MLRSVYGWALGAFFVLGFAGSARAHWPVAAKPLAEGLRSGSEEQRKAAAESAAQLPRSELEALAVELIEYEDPELRALLVELALRNNLVGVARVASLWERSTSAIERRWAAQLLALQPGRQQLAILGRLVSDHEAEVRLAALSALGATPPQWSRTAAQLVLTSLSDRQPEVRAAGARALGLLRDQSVAIYLAGQLQDAEDEVRLAVVKALSVLAHRDTVPALLGALDDPSLQVSAAAAQALQFCGDQQAIPGLIELIRKVPMQRAQLSALGALFALDPDLAESEFIKALTSVPRVSSSLLSWVRLGSLPRAVDVTDCLAHAVSSELEFCAQLHLLQGGGASALWSPVDERRLSSAQAFSLLASNSTSGRVSPSEERLLVRALEMVSSPGRVGAGERDAVLGYLSSIAQLPGFAFEPLLLGLRRASSQPAHLAALLTLLARAPAPHERPWLRAYRDATHPLVAEAATRLGATWASSAAEFEALLMEGRRELRLVAAETLAEGTKGARARALLTFVEGRKMRGGSILLLAAEGLSVPNDPELQEQLLELFRALPRVARLRLVPALGRSLDASRLSSLVPKLSVPERLQLVQVLTKREDARLVVRGLLGDSASRVVALALETWGWISDRTTADDFLAWSAKRPLYVRAAALRGIGRARARGVLEPLPKDLLRAQDCASKNDGLRAAAWGLAAEASLDCGGREPNEVLLHSSELVVRRAIAAGLLFAPQYDTETEKALRACYTYEPEARVARLCRQALWPSTPKGRSEGRWHSLRIPVPWMTEAPAQFPHMVSVDGRDQLTVSDNRGETQVWGHEIHALGPGLVY